MSEDIVSQVNTSKGWGQDKTRLRSPFSLQLIKLWIEPRQLGKQWAKKREISKMRLIFSKARIVLLPLCLVDSTNDLCRIGTSNTNPPTTCEGSRREEGSAATVTVTPGWQPAGRQASSSLPADLPKRGEISRMPRDSPGSFPCHCFSIQPTLFISIPSLSQQKTKCYREGY